MKIALIGFMATGKTTVGKILSKKTNMKLHETDNLIEKNSGKTIQDIFAQEGEDKFRKIEHQALNECIKEDNIIISCGGGITTFSENVRLLNKNCFTVLLNASPEEIFQRVKQDETRPLLNFDNRLDRIKYLIGKRKEQYEKAADAIINTEGLSPEQIADKIVNLINLKD
ncbi:MAG: shikimate kinase [Candidatus Woesearchaeota archaeon]